MCVLYSVCSSEKVDKWARYADFSIASMPYPGACVCMYVCVYVCMYACVYVCGCICLGVIRLRSHTLHCRNISFFLQGASFSGTIKTTATMR